MDGITSMIEGIPSSLPSFSFPYIRAILQLLDVQIERGEIANQKLSRVQRQHVPQF